MSLATQHMLMSGCAVMLAVLFAKGVDALINRLKRLPPSNPWRRWLTLELWKG